ncbi:MAG: T9SS type A sorting domain-containing protein [Chlorobi bacterium]|nr:T9SS type A sorting domain-containing protein [Chlorobiota bacterium]MCI0715884.1 T9SS type A sorting domain-containing protein [Chlorobiota bacterium]
MKNKLSLLFTLLLFTADSQSQWQPDVRLTNDPAESYTSFNSAWCIAARDSVVHLVWFDNRDGNFEIYYRRSTDGGISWGADTRLTNNSASSGNPSISVTGLVVHIAWHDFRNGTSEIYYKRSTDGGISWGADVRLTNNFDASEFSSVSVSGSFVHVVWQDFSDGDWEVFYKRSTDAGVSWSVDTRLTNDSINSFEPSVSVSGSVVHVVWYDFRHGQSEIYYKRSTDDGISWGVDARLTNDPAASGLPSISVSGSVVHVVWFDNRDGNYEIYYKHSTDGGLSWETDTRLTNAPNNSWFSSVSVSGSVVHVVWVDFRDGNYEIYYKHSTDGGLSWETDTRLTNNSAASNYPSVSVSGSVVHVIWTDLRDGNREIYYKRNPTGNPVGIININSEIPKEFSLSQNYPNPFNPSTIIHFQLSINSFTSLKIYDVLGREVAALVNEQLNAGTYEVDWSADNFPGGVYFYSLYVNGSLIKSRKMMLLK